MPDAADLAAAVGQRLEQTPYRVVDLRPDGFTMVLDLADARWWGVLSASGLRESFEHVVRVTPDGRYATTDRHSELEWTVGPQGGPVPRVGARLRASSFQGRTWSFSTRTVVGGREGGTVGPVVAYAYSSATGRRIIDDAARGLGLRERMAPATKIGLVAAIFGGVVAVGGVVLAVVVGATGG
ncbi:hypothetical protein [Cellulosimicrobium protaetiae]|uniref:Uncharacterized protein n=1 Tax=Cellulosimicrobium protaetiae TaxID=2587808 RepID=A0A6M5UE21_9MICO|nr:hypothetical protein [Cellulosimicrobium protaetiae]QJW35463.1 hypothetical protein FIC82_003845 [Cellulosimicrobium protaetiae]